MLLGLRNLLLPAAVALLCLLMAHYFKDVVTPFSTLLTQLPFWLLTFTTLIAAQFNRSRLCLLSLWLIVFYSLDRQLFLDAHFLSRFSELMFLFGLMLCSALLFVQDRSLLSIHVFNRLLLIISCFAAACFWLWASQLWIEPTLQTWNKRFLISSAIIRVDVWVGLLMLLQLGYIAYKPSTSHYTLFTISAIWLAMHYFPLHVPTFIAMSVAAISILLSLLMDSYWLAYRDELTGLPSRRALNQLALSLGSHYSVAMLDVDHFKKFNDTHGHDTGDQVLKLVAAHIRKVTGGGKFFRYGGEEFTVIFPNKDSDEAIPYLEELRENIAHYKMVLREGTRKQKNESYRQKQKKSRAATVSVTISIGVASNQHGQTFEQTIKAADEALYRAKEQGRNRVCE